MTIQLFRRTFQTRSFRATGAVLAVVLMSGSGVYAKDEYLDNSAAAHQFVELLSANKLDGMAATGKSLITASREMTERVQGLRGLGINTPMTQEMDKTAIALAKEGLLVSQNAESLKGSINRVGNALAVAGVVTNVYDDVKLYGTTPREVWSTSLIGGADSLNVVFQKAWPLSWLGIASWAADKSESDSKLVAGIKVFLKGTSDPVGAIIADARGVREILKSIGDTNDAASAAIDSIDELANNTRKRRGWTGQVGANRVVNSANIADFLTNARASIGSQRTSVQGQIKGIDEMLAILADNHSVYVPLLAPNRGTLQSMFDSNVNRLRNLRYVLQKFDGELADPKRFRELITPMADAWLLARLKQADDMAVSNRLLQSQLKSVAQQVSQQVPAVSALIVSATSVLSSRGTLSVVADISGSYRSAPTLVVRSAVGIAASPAFQGKVAGPNGADRWAFTSSQIALAPGRYELIARAITTDGKTVDSAPSVLVAESVSPPVAPTPAPTPVVTVPTVSTTHGPASVAAGQQMTFTANLSSAQNVAKVELIFPNAGVTEAMSQTGTTVWTRTRLMNVAVSNAPYQVRVTSPSGQVSMDQSTYSVSAGVPTPPVPNQTAQPTVGGSGFAQTNSLIERLAAEQGVPSVLVKAIAWQESGWTHLVDGKPKLSSDGGVGIMQVQNGNRQATEEQNIRDGIGQLLRKWSLNVDAGAQAAVRQHGGGDDDFRKDILENWFVPVAAYNGYSGAGAMGQGGGKGYARTIVGMIANPASYQNWRTDGRAASVAAEVRPYFGTPISITDPKVIAGYEGGSAQQIQPYSLCELIKAGGRIHRYDNGRNAIADVTAEIAPKCQGGSVVPGTPAINSPGASQDAGLQVWQRQSLDYAGSYLKNYGSTPLINVAGNTCGQYTYCFAFSRSSPGINLPSGMGTAQVAFDRLLSGGRATVTSNFASIPLGAVVFFAASAANGQAGHAAIKVDAENVVSQGQLGSHDCTITSRPYGKLGTLIGYYAPSAGALTFDPNVIPAEQQVARQAVLDQVLGALNSSIRSVNLDSSTKAQRLGIISSGTLTEPSRAATRGEVTLMIGRALQAVAPAALANAHGQTTFVDAPQGELATIATKLNGLGVLLGQMQEGGGMAMYSDRQVSKAEMQAFLSRSANLLGSVPDAKVISQLGSGTVAPGTLQLIGVNAPAQAVQNQPWLVSVQTNAPAQRGEIVFNDAPTTPVAMTVSGLTLSASYALSKAGVNRTYRIRIFNPQGVVTERTGTVTVTPAATTVPSPMPGIQPSITGVQAQGMVVVNQLATLIFQGQNLTSEVLVTLPNCDQAQTQLLSPTQIRHQCVPRAAGPQNAGWKANAADSLKTAGTIQVSAPTPVPVVAPSVNATHGPASVPVGQQMTFTANLSSAQNVAKVELIFPNANVTEAMTQSGPTTWTRTRVMSVAATNAPYQVKVTVTSGQTAVAQNAYNVMAPVTTTPVVTNPVVTAPVIAAPTPAVMLPPAITNLSVNASGAPVVQIDVNPVASRATANITGRTFQFSCSSGNHVVCNCTSPWPNLKGSFTMNVEVFDAMGRTSGVRQINFTR